MHNLVQRRIYPFLLMIVVLMGILSFQIRQFKRLYEHIKNDKYVSVNALISIFAGFVIRALATPDKGRRQKKLMILLFVLFCSTLIL